MQNTRRFGQILRSKKRPRPTPRSGRVSQINCNTSHQIPVWVIEAVAPVPHRCRHPHVSPISNVRHLPESGHVQSTKFDLIINLKTAKSLGLQAPPRFTGAFPDWSPPATRKYNNAVPITSS